MKKVLWFSRHEMTDEQKAALGDVEIKQINKSINSAYELKDEINECDIIAIVAPVDLQQQFLKLAGNKPVIMAVNDRVLIPQQDGTEDKVAFKFVKWEQLLKIEIVKQDFPLNENSRFLRELALSNLEKNENFNITLLNAIAKHEDTPLDILKKLAEHKFSNIRKLVASNENTPPEILDELSNDENYLVRASVAKNENTSSEILNKLSKDKGVLVKIAVAGNKNTSQKILAELAKDKEIVIRRTVALNENISPEILNELSNDKSEYVRYFIAENKNTPKETLEKLVKDKDNLVSETAKKSLDYIKSNLTSMNKTDLGIENEEKLLDENFER